jgi:S-adenosyl-L-methionine hydrolase (adenosine-forming)
MVSGVVALLTDFGTDDPFVGVMKGVILSRFPAVRLVDLTHGIRPQDVVHGAFWLERSFRWFPGGTVHLAVVDPGVGTERAALAARAHGQLFLGPDNGLLAEVLARDGSAEVRRIEPSRLALPVPSATFHGRDLFAPIAAELAAARLAFEAVGPEAQPSVGRLLAPPVRGADCVSGSVVCADRFGNLISNVEAHLLDGVRRPLVEIAGITRPLLRTYGEAAPGDYVAVVNAFDTVEVAIRDGNAALALGAGRGTPVVVRSA